MLLIHNKRKIKNLGKNFLYQINSINYWDKVEKFFIRKKKKNVDKFIGLFKHGGMNDKGIIYKNISGEKNHGFNRGMIATFLYKFY